MIESRSQGSARVFMSAAGRKMTLESGLEGKVATALHARPNIVHLQEQPAPIRFVDFEGRLRSHYFDFLATQSDGVRVAISVKPEARATPRFRAELRHIAAQVSSNYARGVALITERAVPPNVVSDAQLINSVKQDEDYEAYARLADVVRTLRGAVSIRDLGSSLRRKTSGFRAVIRLIAAGLLLRTDRTPLSGESLVRAATLVDVTERA